MGCLLIELLTAAFTILILIEAKLPLLRGEREIHLSVVVTGQRRPSRHP